MSTKWTIGRRQPACAASGRAFEDGERHVSLVEVVEGELRRSDLSLAAWSARARSGAEAPLFWWMTRHRVNPTRTVQLDLEGLEQLFQRLEGRPETPVRELRYLLCLLLMRKRRLSIERIERGPEGERMLVKRPRRDERYEVFVYDFTPERMEELRAELQAIFDGAEGPEGVRLDGEDVDADHGGAEGHAVESDADGLQEVADGPSGAPGGTRDQSADDARAAEGHVRDELSDRARDA
jgi:hypothetical protein